MTTKNDLLFYMYQEILKQKSSPESLEIYKHSVCIAHYKLNNHKI